MAVGADRHGPDHVRMTLERATLSKRPRRLSIGWRVCERSSHLPRGNLRRFVPYQFVVLPQAVGDVLRRTAPCPGHGSDVGSNSKPVNDFRHSLKTRSGGSSRIVTGIFTASPSLEDENPSKDSLVERFLGAYRLRSLAGLTWGWLKIYHDLALALPRFSAGQALALFSPSDRKPWSDGPAGRRRQGRRVVWPRGRKMCSSATRSWLSPWAGTTRCEPRAELGCLP